MKIIATIIAAFVLLARLPAFGQDNWVNYIDLTNEFGFDHYTHYNETDLDGDTGFADPGNANLGINADWYNSHTNDSIRLYLDAANFSAFSVEAFKLNGASYVIHGYPSLHLDMNLDPIDDYQRLESGALVTVADPTASFDASYDIFFRRTTDRTNNSFELMIWMDSNPAKLTPAGTQMATGVVIGYHTWDIYVTTNTGNGTEAIITYKLADGNRLPSVNFIGEPVDVLAIMQDISYHYNHFDTANELINTLSFGFELTGDNGGGPSNLYSVDSFGLNIVHKH